MPLCHEPSVIYHDNHLLAVNKPTGLRTQPSGQEGPCLEVWAKDWLRTQRQRDGAVFLEAAHRLDKDASGIVLFCRTSKALSRVQAGLRDKSWHKRYLAVVEGELPEKEAMLEDALRHDAFRASVVEKGASGGKQASLSYQVIDNITQKNRRRCSVLSIVINTGRYHQIRVQLASRGFPILGDSKYGSKLPWERGGIALHHTELVLEHPVRREPLELQCPPPALWKHIS